MRRDRAAPPPVTRRTPEQSTPPVVVNVSVTGAAEFAPTDFVCDVTEIFAEALGAATSVSMIATAALGRLPFDARPPPCLGAARAYAVARRVRRG
jgi:hypothetical protein